MTKQSKTRPDGLYKSRMS